MKSLSRDRFRQSSVPRFAGSFVLLLAICGLARSQELSETHDVMGQRDRGRVGRLELDAGSFSTSDLPNLLIDPPERFSKNRHFVVQLDGPITRKRRQRLLALGVELADYLPHYAYLADLGDADPIELAESGELIWIGEFRREWKVEVGIGSRPLVTEPRRELAELGRVAVVVTLPRGVPASTALERIADRGLMDFSVHRVESVGWNTTLLLTLPQEAVAGLADLSEVQWIEEASEITQRNNSTRWLVQSGQIGVTPVYDAGIHGEGQVLAIMDGRLDVGHCSFLDTEPFGPKHRKVLAYNTNSGADIHGTHVTGTAVGDSGEFDHKRGVAYASKLVFNLPPSSYSEAGIFARLKAHHEQGARIHSNSYGDDGTTRYNELCRGIDAFSYLHEDSLVLFAVTNSSSLKNPENAKNLLAVGASQDSPVEDRFCSGGTGPTRDGRRKPEIFAPGCGTVSSAAGSGCSVFSLTGTSMACPAVAGAALLVRQYFTDGYYPTGSPRSADRITPSGALVKATLLNSSVNMTGVSGYPSRQEGWGRIELDRSLFFPGDDRTLQLVADIRNASGLSTGEVESYIVDVASSALPLRLTLVFTDVAAAAGTGSVRAAVNDVDLEFVSPSGELYRGNVFVGGASVLGGEADSINNVEQILIPSPEVGFWTVRARGGAIHQGTQGFAIVACGSIVPDLPPVRVRVPLGVPESVTAGRPTSFEVTVSDGDEGLVDGSPALHVRVGGGRFEEIFLVALGGDDYRASLPARTCGDRIEFYLRARGDRGATVVLPPGAPGTMFVATVGSFETIFADDFETFTGWSTQETGPLSSGGWVRAAPPDPSEPGSPSTDRDGSGRCFSTGGGTGGGDVDGGVTTLTSPAFDLSRSDAQMRFSTWFFDNSGDETLRIEITGDGRRWTALTTIGAGGSGGWTDHVFRLSDFIEPSSMTRVRFIVGDLTPDATVEAAVDAFQIIEIECNPVPERPDLSIADLKIDFDPSKPGIDPGPGAVGQAIDVVLSVFNAGNVPITAAAFEVIISSAGGAIEISRSVVVQDFAEGPGTQALGTGEFTNVIVSIDERVLQRCGAYSLSVALDGATLNAEGGQGPIQGDINPSNDCRVDYPDTWRRPDDEFSPDLLRLALGTIVATIPLASQVIEDRASEPLNVEIDFTGLGRGGDFHDVRLVVDLTDLRGSTIYLNVFSRSRDRVRSTGRKSLRLRLDVSDRTLFPAPQAGDRFRVRLRLIDRTSGELCIEALSADAAILSPTN